MIAVHTTAGRPLPGPARPSRAVAGVPRWASVAAHATVFTVLPSSLWRLPMAFGYSMGFSDDFREQMHVPGWGSVYVVSLGVLSELFAFLTLGLVRSWGETWPRFVPYLHGRRIPVLAAVIPATIGAALVLLYSAGLCYMVFAHTSVDAPTGGALLLMNICYLPILAWGPLLIAVTVHYYRRRRSA